MSLAQEKEQSPTPTRRRSDYEKRSTTDEVQTATESKGRNPYLRVFRYADSKTWTLNIVAIIAAIAAGTLLPLMDLIFGKFITTFTGFASSTVSPVQFRSEINKYTLYFLYLFVAKFATVYIHSVCISIAAIRTTKALRLDFLSNVLRQNIAYFDAASVSVTTQASTSSDDVNTGISEKLTLTIQGVSTFVSAFIIAFAVQWKLTLITISIVPTIIVTVGLCIGIDAKNEAQLTPVFSAASLLAEEAFSTMRTVHSFWLHPFLSRKYDESLEKAEVLGLKKSPIYAVLFSTEFFCIYSGYGLAFWQGIRMYFRGEIRETGDVFTVSKTPCSNSMFQLHVGQTLTSYTYP